MNKINHHTFDLNSLIAGILSIYVFVQALFPQMERLTFWGELIVIAVFSSCFSVSFFSVSQKKILNLIYVWIFLLPLYASLVVLLNTQDYLPYYHFRHLAIFYYAVFFFAAYRWGNHVLQNFSALPFILLLFFLVGLRLFTDAGIGPSILLAVLWLASMQRYNRRLTFYGGFCILLFAHFNGTGTGKVVILGLGLIPLLLFFAKAWAKTGTEMFRHFFLRLVLIVSFFVSIMGAYWFSNTTSNLMSVGRDINAYENGIPGADLNVVWRLVLWTHLFDRFIEHPLGVGIGTPLHEDYLSKFMALDSATYKNEEKYVVGAHNSYVTFLVRFGIAFIVYALFLFKQILSALKTFFEEVRFNPMAFPQARLVFASFVVFMVATLQASFNVVMESPVYAGLYWFSFGLFVRKIGDYRLEER